MKYQFTILVLAALLMSCGEGKQKVKNDSSSPLSTKQNIDSTQSEVKKESMIGKTLLCKLDGEDWGYTKASGLVFTEKTTGKRTAVFTFNNKLAKGKESMQIEYLIDEQKITRIIVNKKYNDLSGKLNSTLYCLLRKKNDYSGSLVSKGKVSVENGLGSGSGQFVAENQFDKKEFEEKYHYVEVTDLNFKNVQFSDLDAAKKKLESLTGEKNIRSRTMTISLDQETPVVFANNTTIYHDKDHNHNHQCHTYNVVWEQ